MSESRKIIYLDHNATTPVDPRVLEVMLPYFTEIFGNAASIDHEAGLIAQRAVEQGREQCAKLIGAKPEEIIFTSGATESNNITCVTEHKAVLDCCAELERRGKRVTYLPVDQYGLVDPEAVRKAITPQTILISIMFANNEIGTIAPIAEIGAIAHEHGVIFHTDAAQAVGHVPVDVNAMNIDLLSFSAHKAYGPKGVGGLYVRRSRPRVKVAPIIYGGGHERGMRSGTLNVPGIVGMGKALEIAGKEMKSDTARYREWTQEMLTQLRAELGEENIALNGHPTQRLPHNLNVSIRGIESRSLIVQLKDVAISTGSACTTAKVEPSHVVLALGYGETRAHSAIRIGLGRFLVDKEITTATDTIFQAIRKLFRFEKVALQGSPK